ncbi:MAG: pyrimidine 5'-nucleotidase [Caulobacterales bacterium]
MIGPDLRHVETWLFDLDNTLYPVETGFGREIEGRITDYVQRITGLPRAEAYTLQKRYLEEHGLTLRGLMLNHGVDPDEFHALFHDLSLEALAEDAELTAALRRLPGRRLIFTNADDVHAERVLRRLGLADLFEHVFHIASADFVPKPSPEAFEKLSAALAVSPASTAFFEDRVLNLEPAAALGMTTVLVGSGAEASTAPFVRHRAPRLARFLADAHVMDH